MMHVLYPQFQVRYNVNHSCGHDRQKLDALNTSQTNKEYGGSIPKINNMIIVDG